LHEKATEREAKQDGDRGKGKTWRKALAWNTDGKKSFRMAGGPAVGIVGSGKRRGVRTKRKVQLFGQSKKHLS